MVALCRQKAKAFVDGWRDWQKQEPRVFQDTEIRDADMARYSLLLVGGPDANRVTAKLAARLPLQIATDRDHDRRQGLRGEGRGRADPLPEPAQPRALRLGRRRDLDRRHVLLRRQRHATSPTGTTSSRTGASPRSGRRRPRSRPGWSPGCSTPTGASATRWPTPATARSASKGRLRHRPSASLVVDPTLLESYVGRYQIEKGPLLEVFLDGKRLMVRQQGQSDADELLPESATEFSVPKYSVWISFVRDASGKVTELVGYQGGDFTAKRVD